MSPLRTVIALVLVAAGLIATGWIVATNNLWSTPADLTVPWLCSTLAVALLIVAAASAVCQQPPASIPMKATLLIYLGVVLVFGVGIVVDAAVYYRWAGLTASLAEWLGFSVILLGCLCIPRLAAREMLSDERNGGVTD
jgi:hypothetical protein